MTWMQIACVSGLACSVAASVIFWAKGQAARWQLVDCPSPDPLKVHRRPTPLVGGLGVVAGIASALPLVWVWSPQQFVPCCVLVTAAAALAAIGLVDDRQQLRPVIRLTMEFCVTLLAALGLMLFTQAEPNSTRTLFAHSGWPAALTAAGLCLFALGAVNALNMVDGLDGLAGGVALISCLGCGLAAYWQVQTLPMVLAAALAAALAGFLLFNLPPARVFLGDHGAYPTGMLMGFLAILASPWQKGLSWGLVCAVLLVGWPIADVAFAIIRRLALGKSPFKGDRSHAYDLLRAKGWSVWQVDGICYSMQLLLVGAALTLVWKLHSAS